MKAYFRPDGTVLVKLECYAEEVPQSHAIVVDLNGLTEGNRKLRIRRPSYTHEVPVKAALLIHAAGPPAGADEPLRRKPCGCWFTVSCEH